MKNRNLIILGSCLLAVILIGIVALIAMGHQSGNSYTEQIELAEKYVKEERYDEAIQIYQAVINMDDERYEAYIGLAGVYREQGYDSLAVSALETGCEKTNNDHHLMNWAEENGYQLSLAVVRDDEDDDEKTVSVSLNESMIQFVAGANYKDYKTKYQVNSYEKNGDETSVSFKNLGIDLKYKNTNGKKKFDTVSGQPFEESVPDYVEFLGPELLFAKKAVTLEEIKELHEISMIQENEDNITFETKNCKVVMECSPEDGADEDTRIAIYPKNNGKAGGGGVIKASGLIKDASTGSELTDATVRAYQGYSARGEYEEAKTNSMGEYNLPLNSGGMYIFEIIKDGYITTTFEVYVLSNGATQADFTISQELGENEIRIVLSWDAQPTDLDSHLTIEDVDEVNFSNTQVKDDNGTVIAELDVDDRDGYGPETITLHSLSHRCNYWVHDYTQSGMMFQASAAQITVYSGSSIVSTYTIPETGSGDIWDVFEINLDGEIIDS